MNRAARILLSLVAWVALGVAISGVILRLPTNMPDFLDNGIRAALQWTQHDEMVNTDDIEDIALLVILAASFLVSGLIVFAANLAFRRRRRREAA